MKLIFLLTTIVLLLTGIFAYNGRRCTVTNRNDGICVKIRSCPDLLNRYLQSGPLNREKVKSLQRITCGFEGNDPKVCCQLTSLKPVENSRNQHEFLHEHPKFHQLPLVNDCGSSWVTIWERIIGGKSPPLGAFPWLGRIGYETNENKKISFYCGASVINKRYLLTAAHCVNNNDGEFRPVLVKLGEFKTKTDPDCSVELGCSFVQDYEIEKVIPHPGYDTQAKQNDIALIRVNRDISFQSSFVQPICLPFVKEFGLNFSDFGQKTEQESVNYEDAIVAGWGRTRHDVPVDNTILQYIEIPIVPNKRCKRIYEGRTTISELQLCAGGMKGEDSCDGDSGGPLFVRTFEKKYFQIAIVSYGPTKCGSKGLPGIYTRVTEYLKWILDSID